MLVLGRKQNERIVIGVNRDIIIEVVNIKGNQVRIGITCDRDIPVNREEILEARLPPVVHEMGEPVA